MDIITKDIQYRKKRISRIKKFIMFFLCILIIIPIFLCFLLFNKVANLEKKIDDLKSYTQSATIGEQKAGVTDLSGHEVKSTINGKITDDSMHNENLDDQELSNENSRITQTLTGKNAYLTFDDGPSDNTDMILDILAKYNVKATFFVIQKTDQASIERYKRILREGHTLAMHSSSHVYSKIYNSIDDYIQDVSGIQNFLYNITGIMPTIYRFPGGSSNTVSKISIYDCVNYLNQMGITYFDWNVSSGDAESSQVTSGNIIDNVVKGVEQEDNSVILMHDANNKKVTVEALPDIIQKLTDMGVHILPITDKTAPIHHKINK